MSQHKFCDDCGTRLHGLICPNCDEELLIVTEQAADIDFPLSAEFAGKVDEQKQRVIERGRRVDD